MKPNLAAPHRAGFTLIEVLVIVGMVVLLAVLTGVLYPGSRAHNVERARATQCLNNVKQLAAGWATYPADNADQLMPNPGWVSGNMGWEPGAGLPEYFDQQRLLDPKVSLMADYVKSADVYKCPADAYKLGTYTNNRVRSISMNGVLVGLRGSGPNVQGDHGGDRKYFGKGALGAGGPARKTSDLLPGPAQIFVLLDEHPDSITDATFMFDPGYAPEKERWRDLPAGNHQGATAIAFADGHAELHKWEETSGPKSTLYPVTRTAEKPWTAATVGPSKDYEWLQERMPWR